MSKAQKWLNFFRTIKFGLVFCNIAILLVSVSFIIFYTQSSNNKALIDTAYSFMSISNNSIVHFMKRTFNNIESITKNGSKIFSNSPSSEEILPVPLQIMGGYLTENPYASNIFFGKKDGFYVSCIRRNDKDSYKHNSNKELPNGSAYAWRTINDISHNSNAGEGEKDRQEKLTYFDENYTKLDEEIIKGVQFDPRRRPWYEGAKDERRSVSWTDVYFFQGGIFKEAGIIASIPLVNSQKEQVGVFGVDVVLSSLEKLLKDAKFTPGSNLYVVSATGQIICSTGELPKKRDEKDNLIFPSISDPELAHIKHYLEVGTAPVSKNTDSVKTAEFEGQEILVHASPFQLGNIHWKILSTIPLEDLLEPIRKKRTTTLLYCFFILSISSFIMFLFTRRISLLISDLSKAALQVESFQLDDAINVKSSIVEIQGLSHSMEAMRHSMSSFSKYVPKDLVLKLIQEETHSQIGGDYKEITMLFTDIQNFTHISEALKPNDLILQMSDYFEVMTQTILDHNGNVDKYIGDSIMSFWGAPTANLRHASDACYAALMMQRVLRTKNSDWINLGLPPFVTRMGIHTGNVIVGNMGSSLRMNYTAIGDDVNLSARLEGLNKYYHTEILISGDTYAKVSADFLARPLGRVAVKGKEISTPIYELIGGLKHVDPKLLLSPQRVKDYEKYRVAYDYFEQRRFAQALEIFSDIGFKDGPVDMMIDECKKLCENPPGEDWKGFVRHMDSK